MKVDLCPSGQLFLFPENDNEKNDIYEFFGENSENGEKFKMKLFPGRVPLSEDNPVPVLNFYLESEDNET